MRAAAELLDPTDLYFTPSLTPVEERDLARAVGAPEFDAYVP